MRRVQSTASDQVVDFSVISEAAISDGLDGMYDGITSKQYRSDPDGDLTKIPIIMLKVFRFHLLMIT